VEEPNAHLFLKPVISYRHPAYVPIPQIDFKKCTYCGKCGEVCAYHAIAALARSDERKGSILLFSNLCHGCGACSLLCPEKAITETNREIGTVEIGQSGDIQFIHGRLKIGEAMAPPLIRKVKQYINSAQTVILDAPPGTSCPMVSAVKGSDFCLLVTEPTPFGLNDLVLAVETVRTLGIPCGVIINRSDIGDHAVESYCREQNIPILMQIPFDRGIAELYSAGIPLVEARPEWRERFQKMFSDIREMAGSRP
jgi:MinD superfamily P-loop ATPase